MTEIEDLLDDIEELRSNLLDLIDQKESNLQDPEVIAASKILNSALTKYNELIIEKSKGNK